MQSLNKATLDLARFRAHFAEKHDAIIGKMIAMLSPAVDVEEFWLAGDHIRDRVNQSSRILKLSKLILKPLPIGT